MHGDKRPASARHSSRLIAAMDNAQDGRGFALAEVIASRAGEGGRPAPSSPQPSSEQSSREPADLAVTAPPPLLQRHFANIACEATLVMAAAGLGLAFAPPARPMQTQGVVDAITQQHGQQAPHFRGGEGDQAAVIPPFAPVWAAARVTARKAWASRHSVTCRYHPFQRRTSY
jgi:hypothetical protein